MEQQRPQEQFDELPIGKGAKIEIDEYPPDFDPTMIEAKKQPLPIGKRLQSKVWKAKKEALEQLLQIVTESIEPDEFRQYEKSILKAMADSNVQCQLLSSKILLKFLQNNKKYEIDFKPIVKNVIQKTMANPKQEMQNIGLELIYISFDSGHKEMLFQELNGYLLNKNPKIVANSFNALRQFLSNYGPKKMDNFEKFEKNFKLIASNARPIAKESSIELFKEMYKWMGESTLQFSIHPEIKESIVKWSKTYQMENMEIKRGLEGEKGKTIDPTEEEEEDSSPVDALATFDSKWVDTVLAIEKWKVKKEALSEFIKKTKVKSIVPRDTSHYITLIRRIFSENNINLIQCGFKIVRNLSKGLGKHFSTSCRAFLSYVYLKLKDSKAMIVDDTLQTLSAMSNCISLEDMQEEIKVGLRDKSPQMRLNSLRFLKEFAKVKDAKSVKVLKGLLDQIVKLNNDGSSEVRTEALSMLCKIKQFHGMLFFEHRLEGLPPKKIAEVKQTVSEREFPQENQQPKCDKMELEVPKGNQRVMKHARQVKHNKENVSQKASSLRNGQLKKPQIEQGRVQRPPSMETQASKLRVESINQIINSLPKVEASAKNLSERRSDEDIINQEWPTSPGSEQVIRLISVLNRMGEPFPMLAKPFRLLLADIEKIRSFSDEFVYTNSLVLLKWSLWRMLIEDRNTAAHIIDLVCRVIVLKGNDLSDKEMLLFMSTLSNCLEHDCIEISGVAWLHIAASNVSAEVRMSVFNFWMMLLTDSSPEFAAKVIEMLIVTYPKIQLTAEELINIARIDSIAKNKTFLNHLCANYNRNMLKIYGFKIEEVDAENFNAQNYLLKIEGPEFYIACSQEEKARYMEVFKKHSGEFFEGIGALEAEYEQSQIINLHLKIMDTIMLPYFSHSVSLINVYSYFKLFSQRLNAICETAEGKNAKLSPYLRSLIRLLTFFLVDLNDSKMDNKGEVLAVVNKIVIVLLENLGSDHLLECLTILQRYAVKNKLSQKLASLLTRCVNKVTKTASFRAKLDKNLAYLSNFCIGLMDAEKINSESPYYIAINSILENLMNNFLEPQLKVVSEQLKAGTIASPDLLSRLNEFLSLGSQKLKQLNEEKEGQNAAQNGVSSHSERPMSVAPSQKSYLEEEINKLQLMQNTMAVSKQQMGRMQKMQRVSGLVHNYPREARSNVSIELQRPEAKEGVGKPRQEEASSKSMETNGSLRDAKFA